MSSPMCHGFFLHTSLPPMSTMVFKLKYMLPYSCFELNLPCGRLIWFGSCGPYLVTSCRLYGIYVEECLDAFSENLMANVGSIHTLLLKP
ncbi:hypothetical protein SCA6_019418 [Theobroma cacao]